MTATPRTDAALYPMNGVEIVWPYFARQLETELARLRAQNDQVSDNLSAVGKAYNAEKDRAEKAEAALAEWSVLNLWGGTPEIIHEFIKGQQNRIHHCQDLETELAHLRAAIDAAMKGTT